MTNRETEILWREEKYRVMYFSQAHYNKIREAMRDETSYEEIATLIEEALAQTPTNGSRRNACSHMWGYFKKFATEEEKCRYQTLLENNDFKELLYFLQLLTEHYNVSYVKESRILQF